MFRPSHLALGLLLLPALARAQNNRNTPTVVPAGDAATVPSTQTPAAAPPHSVTAKQTHEADDAYLTGAKQIDHHDYEAAEQSFARAVQLNPNDDEYTLALVYAREARVTSLVRNAAIARKAGDAAQADRLLAQAHTLDPDNRIAAQHLSAGGDVLSPTIDPLKFPISEIASTLAGPTELTPTPGKHSFHEQGDAQTVLRAVYRAFGIEVQFDPSITSSAPLHFDLEDVDYTTSTQFLHQITRTFAAAVQPNVAIIAKDTQENRDRLLPLVEETLYIPGQTPDQMTELATLARDVYDVKNITASASAGTLLVRADEPTLKLLNAQYADMLDGPSDVLLDVTLYEIDESTVRNFGATLPSSISAFPLASELQSALTSNAAAIAAAEQAGLLTLSGSQLNQTLQIIEFLAGAGLLNATQLSDVTNLIGTIGVYDKLPFLGVALASGTTVTAIYTSNDVRILDDTQIRAGNGQPASFRSGTRYPVVTSTYTTGGSSSISSALSSLPASLQSLAAQYGLGSGASTTIPQIQYEDLGLTLKATPKIERDQSINLALDLKIEAIGAGSLNGIPVLNNRQLTSTVTIPAGQSALLLSDVNRAELGSVTGLPGLNDLPGFSGTSKDLNKSTSEILIAITPHVVREQRMRVTSKRLAFPHYGNNPFD